MRTSEIRDQPWRRVPIEEAVWMRPLVPLMLDAMAERIRAHVPEYARPQDATYGRVLQQAVEQAADHFVRIIADPAASWGEIGQVFFDIGYGEAVEGRSLDHLQSAMRLGSRVAWQHLGDAAERLGRPPSLITLLAEAIFVYLDELASAAAEGFSRARELAATEREHRRGRLFGLLLSDPPPPYRLIEEQAAAAGWRLPARLAVAVLGHRDFGFGPAGLPPELLAGTDRGDPCLIVPDADGPGRLSGLARTLTGWQGALGPAVPVRDAALSLAWARRTLELLDAGTITSPAPIVSADDHIPALLIAQGGPFVRSAAARRLAPLDGVGPKHARRLARTLLECLNNGFNAKGAAHTMKVHPQTVRYRLGQLHDIFDRHFDMESPELRLELTLLLHTWLADPDRAGDG